MINQTDLVWVLLDLGASKDIPYLIGSTKYSVWDLWTAKEAYVALLHHWSPSTHCKFSKPIRDAIVWYVFLYRPS